MKLSGGLLALMLGFQAHAAPLGAGCAQEGESAGGSTLGAKSCCPGLIQTNQWTHQNLKLGCQTPVPPGSSGSCVLCGDGKCDTANFENKCVCPKDCADPLSRSPGKSADK